MISLRPVLKDALEGVLFLAHLDWKLAYSRYKSHSLVRTPVLLLKIWSCEAFHIGFHLDMLVADIPLNLTMTIIPISATIGMLRKRPVSLQCLLLSYGAPWGCFTKPCKNLNITLSTMVYSSERTPTTT